MYMLATTDTLRDSICLSLASRFFKRDSLSVSRVFFCNNRQIYVIHSNSCRYSICVCCVARTTWTTAWIVLGEIGEYTHTVAQCEAKRCIYGNNIQYNYCHMRSSATPLVQCYFVHCHSPTTAVPTRTLQTAKGRLLGHVNKHLW